MFAWLTALAPVEQEHLLEARQMQALSFAVHIPLVCFGIAFPSLVVFTEWLHLRTGDPVYSDSPTMIVSVPACTWGTLPDTGASSMAAPRPCTRFASSRLARAVTTNAPSAGSSSSSRADQM